MKIVAIVAGVLFLTAVVPAMADTYAYVSVADQKQVAVFKVDAEQGKLTKIDEVTVKGVPGSLGIDPEKRFLFASLRSSSELASFRIDAGTGKLTPVNVVGTGINAAFVGTDRSGKFLLSASYASGKVMVHGIGKDGTIGDALQTVETVKTAHCIVTVPSNKFAFVPHPEPNAVFQFKFDAATGKLTANEPDRTMAPKGAGPRHLVFHPTKPIAYTSDETASSVSTYSFDSASGIMKPTQTLSTLPEDFKGKNTCAEVKVHPSGKFVYVSNRGHDSIACYTADADGKLTAAGQAPTEKTPRSFDIEPDGKFLYSAGEGTGKLASYRIDAKTGELKRLEEYEVGKQLSWVVLVKSPGK